MKNPIGGFIELEISVGSADYHPNALALSNGRACFNQILKAERPSMVYVPFYTCNALLDPLEINGIPYKFYRLGRNLEPLFDGDLKSDEMLVVINYYGINGKLMEQFDEQYRQQLIIDNTMGFFCKEYDYAFSFNSCRKFFGVPDGGYLYSPTKLGSPPERITDIKTNYLISRILKKEDVYYQEYLENEKNLSSKILGMSFLTELLLSNVDFELAKSRRRSNFLNLHDQLKELNLLNLKLTEDDVPHYYPLLPLKKIDKSKFHRDKIFVPTLWPDVLTRGFSEFAWEREVTERIIPLPVDHRYNHTQMEILVDRVMQEI